MSRETCKFPITSYLTRVLGLHGKYYRTLYEALGIIFLTHQSQVTKSSVFIRQLTTCFAKKERLPIRNKAFSNKIHDIAEFVK